MSSCAKWAALRAAHEPKDLHLFFASKTGSPPAEPPYATAPGELRASVSILWPASAAALASTR
jgi:hypothetical protein